MLMWLGLLGPLEVRAGHAAVPITAAKQRVLLATLARSAQPGRAGRGSQLRPLGRHPAGACGCDFAQLRQAAAAGTRARGRPTPAHARPGYLLAAGDREIDLQLFTT